MKNVVAKVDALREEGLTTAAACKKVKTTPAVYYYQKKKEAPPEIEPRAGESGLSPAVIKARMEFRIERIETFLEILDEEMEQLRIVCGLYP